MRRILLAARGAGVVWAGHDWLRNVARVRWLEAAAPAPGGRSFQIQKRERGFLRPVVGAELHSAIRGDWCGWGGMRRLGLGMIKGATAGPLGSCGAVCCGVRVGRRLDARVGGACPARPPRRTRSSPAALRPGNAPRASVPGARPLPPALFAHPLALRGVRALLTCSTAASALAAHSASVFDRLRRRSSPAVALLLFPPPPLPWHLCWVSALRSSWPPARYGVTALERAAVFAWPWLVVTWVVWRGSVCPNCALEMQAAQQTLGRPPKKDSGLVPPGRRTGKGGKRSCAVFFLF